MIDTLTASASAGVLASDLRDPASLRADLSVGYLCTVLDVVYQYCRDTDTQTNINDRRTE